MAERSNPPRRNQHPAAAARRTQRGVPPRQTRGGSRQARDRSPKPSAPSVHLADDIVKELRATSRPGKAEILVKVFAEAAGAYAEENLDEAIRLGEQAKHMALRSASIRELLGIAYYRAGTWKEAARELSAFRRLSGSTEQNPLIADCYRAMGKPEKSLEITAEIDPRRADPAVVYEGAIVAAGALGDMRRLDDAVAMLERLDLRPNSPAEHHLRAWYALGDLLERRGRFTQAREWFEAVNDADPDMTDAAERLARLQTSR
ncbi:MAG: tetratricopeptide repeat protein [Actinomycetota bacterium]|nr:tetratricopeptide repeat protein [Actinomycetota bacterium]